MNLPLINTFSSSLNIYTTREPTLQESIEYMQKTGKALMPRVNDKLIASISNAFEAAKYIGQYGPDNIVGNHITDHLATNNDFRIWRQSMPSKIPKALEDYQKRMSSCNLTNVKNEISQINRTLSEGQYLFHGGHWNFGTSLSTTKPLSATFCPVVAMCEALHKGKAYDAGQLDIWVLRATNPKTNVYVYNPNARLLGHEKEVLFNSGALLTVINRTLVHHNMKVSKVDPNSYRILEKNVPVNIIEISIT